MRDKILLTKGQVCLQGLERLCQQGMEVHAFTQKFGTRAERLGSQGMDFKDIFIEPYEPAPVREPSESSPEPGSVQELSESTHEPTPAREP